MNEGKLSRENKIIGLIASLDCSDLKKVSPYAYQQIKALVEGKVSDEFVEKWAKEITRSLYHLPTANTGKAIIKQLLEDYHKELMR